MNLIWLRLFLVLLWLVPALGLFVLEWTTGTIIALPIGNRQLPLAWPFALMAAYNFARWWAVKSQPKIPPIERRRPRTLQSGEPDPNFQFDRE